MALSSLPVPTHGFRVLPPKAVVLVKMPPVPGMLPSCRPYSLLHPKSHFPPYGPSYLAHIKGIHPIRSWALAQTGPALGPLTPRWEVCRRAGTGRESMLPQHPLPCAFRGWSHWALPVVTLTDVGSAQLQGPLGRGCLATGCPGNVSCRGLQDG